MKKYILGVLSVALASVSAAQDRFDGHRVVRVEVPDSRTLMTVLALTDDVWTHEAGPGPLDVRLEPDAFAQLVALGLPHRVLIDDLQVLIDEERARLAAAPHGDAGWFDDFKNNAAIIAKLEEFAATHPDLCQLSVVGQSLESRPMYALRVTGPGNSEDRPVIFIHGCQHAREWISPMTVMFYIEQLLGGYGSDPNVAAILDNVEFLFVPMSNPDGYQWTWDVNRMWRKNRRVSGGNCFGVDINRNWGFQWGNNNGSSGDPCSDIYRGTAPFSEPETQVMRDYMAAEPNLRASIDFHSYSQLILSPWGYTSELPPAASMFDGLNQGMASAVGAVHGMTYTAGPTYTTIYPASGVAGDWSYGVLGAIGYGWELRDTGQTGFLLPPEQIVPTGEENYEAVKLLATFIRDSAFEFLASPPAVVATQTATVFGVSVQVIGNGPLPGSETLRWRVKGSGTYATSALSPTGPTTYEATLPGMACGTVLEFFLEGESLNGATVRLPSGTAVFEALSADTEVLYSETFDPVGPAWTVGAPGDTATRGIWGIMDPEPTAAQPGDDHTPAPGVNCFVTDGRAGTSVGAWDVDDGATTLTSPVFSGVGTLSGGETRVVYHRWYSNDQGAAPNADSMPVRLSRDGGATWQDLELVTENANAWVRKEFVVADPTASMRLRFVARDEGAGSIVEAGVDDVQVLVRGCGTHKADCEGDGDLDVFDYLCFLGKFSVQDPYADFEGDGDWDLFDFLAFQDCFAGGGC